MFIVISQYVILLVTMVTVLLQEYASKLFTSYKSKIKFNDIIIISNRCVSGFDGKQCNTPVCSPSCVNGKCTSPGHCRSDW